MSLISREESRRYFSRVPREKRKETNRKSLWEYFVVMEDWKEGGGTHSGNSNRSSWSECVQSSRWGTNWHNRESPRLPPRHSAGTRVTLWHPLVCSLQTQPLGDRQDGREGGHSAYKWSFMMLSTGSLFSLLHAHLPLLHLSRFIWFVCFLQGAGETLWLPSAPAGSKKQQRQTVKWQFFLLWL